MPETTTITVRLVLDHAPSYTTNHYIDEAFTDTDSTVAFARAYRRARALMGGRGDDVPVWVGHPMPYGWSLETMDDTKYGVAIITRDPHVWDEYEQRRVNRLMGHMVYPDGHEDPATMILDNGIPRPIVVGDRVATPNGGEAMLATVLAVDPLQHGYVTVRRDGYSTGHGADTISIHASWLTLA